MTDPAIRAALEAAVRRFCECDGACRFRPGLCDAPVHYIAAAIVLFLRGLPSHIGGNVAMFTPEELAAAVEAAAKEPGHD